MNKFWAKKSGLKKGFTIVELVIVIAVIAILAAVLIPTFSSIIKKSNLSADKQAVREMNEALAQWEAEHAYQAVPDVDSVMVILANAGYNTDNWVCLTEGYEVYWYQNDNRMVLYNASTAEIEYPDQYVGKGIMVSNTNNFFLYNENHVKAQQFDVSLGSATGVTGKNEFANVTGSTNAVEGSMSNATANLGAMQSTLESNTAVKTALKISSNAYMYASKETVSLQVPQGTSNYAYASMQIASVGATATPQPINIKNNGQLVENYYYISVVNEGGSPAEVKAAQQAAAKYVYTVFDQITTGKVQDDVTIVLAPGTTLDCASSEWAPCKSFSGYFGTTDADKPIVIDGARLGAATSYSQTVRFDGSSSKYFLTGFFGSVYGNTTIENVVFQNLTFENPANDYERTTADITGELVHSRNTVGIIGGVVDHRTDRALTPAEVAKVSGLSALTNGATATINGADYYRDGNVYYVVEEKGVVGNVVLRNINVKSSCKVISAGCAGGLVGYVGSSASFGNKYFKVEASTLLIDNCTVSTQVSSSDSTSKKGYATVGGILGFGCRASSWTTTIKDTVFNGTASGYKFTGAITGMNQPGTAIVLAGTIDVSDATLIKAGEIDAKLGVVAGGSIKKAEGAAINFKAEWAGDKGTGFYTDGYVEKDFD